MEQLAAIFAGAIHDVDHPGVTSQYLINSGELRAHALTGAVQQAPNTCLTIENLISPQSADCKANAKLVRQITPHSCVIKDHLNDNSSNEVKGRETDFRDKLNYFLFPARANSMEIERGICA
jgi:hypothetical protein